MSGSYLKRRDSYPAVQNASGSWVSLNRYSEGSYGPYGYQDPQYSGGGGKEQIERVLDLLFRRKWLIIGAFLLAIGVAAAYTYTRVPRYQSLAFVTVELTRYVTTGGDVSGDADNVFARNDRTLTGEITLLQISEDLRRRVFQRMPRPNGYVTFLPQQGATNIIQIVGSSPDAARAAEIANTYAEEYVKLTQEASRTYLSKQRETLEGKVDDRLKELNNIEREISEYIARTGSSGLDQNGTALLGQIDQLESQREQLRINLQMAQSSLSSIEQQIKEINPNLTERYTAERKRTSLDNEIQETQALLDEEKDKLNRILRNNPDMNRNLDVLKPYNDRIASLQADVDSLTSDYIEVAAELGNVTGGQDGLSYLANLQQQATDKRIDIQGIESQITVINNRLGQYQGDLSRLPSQSMEMVQLERRRMQADRMYQYVVQRLEATRIAEESEPGYAKLLRAAMVPSVPVYPTPMRDLVLGAFLGLLLGFGLAIIREKLDNRIYQPTQVREHGYKEIAVIPNLRPLIAEDHGGKEFMDVDGQHLSTSLVSLVNPLSAASEAYRQVRTFAQFNLSGTDLQTILVSSPGMEEGKSTTAANLAIVMAQGGKKTLLIDADMRRPKQHKLFGLTRKDGLKELLAGGDEIDSSPWRTYVDNLYVLTAQKVNGSGVQNGNGVAPDAVDIVEKNGFFVVTNPSELLGSSRLNAFLDRMRSEFDIVIIDSPPVLAATDAVMLSTQCDATIVVARTGHTKEGELQYTIESFNDVGANILGVVLNAFDVSMAFGHKYRYSHYTKYGHYSKYGYSDA